MAEQDTLVLYFFLTWGDRDNGQCRLSGLYYYFRDEYKITKYIDYYLKKKKQKL